MGKKLQAPKKVEKLTIQRLNGMEMQKFYLKNGAKPKVPPYEVLVFLEFSKKHKERLIKRFPLIC